MILCNLEQSRFTDQSSINHGRRGGRVREQIPGKGKLIYIRKRMESVLLNETIPLLGNGMAYS